MGKLVMLKKRLELLDERLAIATERNNQTIVQHINKTRVMLEADIAELEKLEG